jgi:hypothetical protein
VGLYHKSLFFSAVNFAKCNLLKLLICHFAKLPQIHDFVSFDTAPFQTGLRTQLSLWKHGFRPWNITIAGIAV